MSTRSENAENKATKKAADKAAKDADTTNKDVASNEQVSRTEHAMGSRQPDDGEYDDQREQAPLEGRDVPQVIVTAENHTPTPGENIEDEERF